MHVFTKKLHMEPQLKAPYLFKTGWGVGVRVSLNIKISSESHRAFFLYTTEAEFEQ